MSPRDALHVVSILDYFHKYDISLIFVRPCFVGCAIYHTCENNQVLIVRPEGDETKNVLENVELNTDSVWMASLLTV
jgi:hypothetical protein